MSRSPGSDVVSIVDEPLELVPPEPLFAPPPLPVPDSVEPLPVPMEPDPSALPMDVLTEPLVVIPEDVFVLDPVVPEPLFIALAVVEPMEEALDIAELMEEGRRPLDPLRI